MITKTEMTDWLKQSKVIKMGDWKSKLGYALTSAGSFWLGTIWAKDRLRIGVICGFAILSGVYTCNRLAPSGMEMIKDKSARDYLIEQEDMKHKWQKDSIEMRLKYDLEKERGTAVDSQKIFRGIGELTQDMEDKYNQMMEEYHRTIENNTAQYKELLSKNDAKYSSSMNVLLQQNAVLQKKIEELQQNSFARIKQVAVSGKNTLEDMTEKISQSQSLSEQGLNEQELNEQGLDHYLVDVDKKNREMHVYSVYSDGSKKYLGIHSKVSLARSGGPIDGVYDLKSVENRRGDLAPKFLVMDGVIGISGAGEHNEHLEEIQSGALANRTGIRTPSEVCSDIGALASNYKTLVYVHD